MPLIIGDPNPPASTEIETQTRCGNRIPNCQASLVTIADQAEVRERRERWQHLDIRGDDVVPHYNCHGLTFASRRTAVAFFEELPTKQLPWAAELSALYSTSVRQGTIYSQPAKYRIPAGFDASSETPTTVITVPSSSAEPVLEK